MVVRDWRLDRLQTLVSVFARIEFRHFRDELIDENLDLGGGVLDAPVQIGLNKQCGNGDDEAGDSRKQGRGDAGCDGVDVHFSFF